MTKLGSRVSKIEKVVHGIDAIRSFMRMMCTVVCEVDPSAGKQLATLIATREREFIKNPERCITTLVSLINTMSSETRETIIEKVVRLRDSSEGGRE